MRTSLSHSGFAFAFIHRTITHTTHRDPARVTVFGRGAGATSACLQAILPPGQHHQDDAGARATITQAAIVESGACYALPLGTFHRSAGLSSRGAG